MLFRLDSLSLGRTILYAVNWIIDCDILHRLHAGYFDVTTMVPEVGYEDRLWPSTGEALLFVDQRRSLRPKQGQIHSECANFA